jgi:putative oxidoreductase
MKRIGKRHNQRSSADVAGLLLRGIVGGTMIAHGVKHGQSLDGTAGWFESIGFRQPRLQAQASAVVEVGVGAALAAGLATPLAAAAVVGTMGVAAQTVHRPNGFFITAEGYEYVLNLAAAAVTVGALGPGRFSLDRLFGLDRGPSGVRGAALVAAVGVASSALQLAAFWRPPTPASS